VHDVARLVAQLRDEFRAWKVSDTGDVLHQAQGFAKHLFDNLHVFGHKRIGVIQHVEFGGIAEIALDKAARWRVGRHASDVECQQFRVRQKAEYADR